MSDFRNIKFRGKTLAYEIEDAQMDLHNEVLSALSRFTERTGLVAYSIEWNVDTEINESGRTVSVSYGRINSDLKTGVDGL